MAEHKDTITGFDWGSVKVERVHSAKGKMLVVKTHDSKGEVLRTVKIVASPKGQSLRVFIDNAEAFTTATDKAPEPKAKKPKKGKKKAPELDECQMGYDQLADGWLRPSCSVHGELGEEYDNYEEAVVAFETHAAEHKKVKTT